jgi:hypothetical protein
MPDLSTNLATADTGAEVYTPIAAGDTGAFPLVSGTCYALHLGLSRRTLTDFLAQFYQSGTNAVAGGGGAALNWAEIAVATGDPGSMAANANLTIRGYSSWNAEALAAATEWRSKLITGLSIPKGLNLWVLIAAAYQTTQPQCRIPVNYVNGRGMARTRANCQPSLNLNAPLAFAGTVTTGTVVPWMSGQALAIS